MSADEVRLLTISELFSEEVAQVPVITFSESLDEILGGGIHLQKITELYGDKGSGKTTFCYQLAIDVQIPASFGGLGSECMFIDTENSFVRKRVEAMAKHCADHCLSLDGSSTLTLNSLLNGIHYVKCGSVLELQGIVQDLKDFIRIYPKVKLIVIDSLAFLFYSASQKFSERGKVLYQLFEALHTLAREQNLAVVVTNNMTTRFSTHFDYRIPFLGEIWTHIPNTRIELVNDKNRNARVIKGKVMVNNTTDFKVTSAGIRD